MKHFILSGLVALAIVVPSAKIAAAGAPSPHAVVKMDLTTWDITLKWARTMSLIVNRSDNTIIHPQGKYIILAMDVKNLGNDPARLDSDQDFRLRDSQGHNFSTASDDSAEYELTNWLHWIADTETVQPTFTIRTAFVFDVAKNSHGFTLYNSSYSRTQRLFAVGL